MQTDSLCFYLLAIQATLVDHIKRYDDLLFVTQALLDLIYSGLRPAAGNALFFSGYEADWTLFAQGHFDMLTTEIRNNRQQGRAVTDHTNYRTDTNLLYIHPVTFHF